MFLDPFSLLLSLMTISSHFSRNSQDLIPYSLSQMIIFLTEKIEATR